MAGDDYGEGTVGEAMQIDPQAKDVQTARRTELVEYESFEAAWDAVKDSNGKTNFFYDETTGAKKPFYQEWEVRQAKRTTQLSSLTLPWAHLLASPRLASPRLASNRLE